ncbi:MAG: peptidoglycan editing factor PgeF [Pseudomonadota bacterium]
MQIIVPDWPGAPDNIGALSTLRAGGASEAPYGDGAGGTGLNLGTHVGDRAGHVQQNRALLQTLLPAQPVWITQVHGSDVIDAAGVKGVPEADASFTSGRGVVCVIQTADCLPVLFCDVQGRVVGAAHAGWRGLAGGVLDNTLGRMRDAGAGEIMAWLGPAIGPSCFEVGDEVLTAFVTRDEQTRTAFKPFPGRPGKYLADIYQLARIKLANAGVRRIAGGDFCTVTDERRFYSYRRDGVTGRMASLIWIK